MDSNRLFIIPPYLTTYVIAVRLMSGSVVALLFSGGHHFIGRTSTEGDHKLTEKEQQRVAKTWLDLSKLIARYLSYRWSLVIEIIRQTESRRSHRWRPSHPQIGQRTHRTDGSHPLIDGSLRTSFQLNWMLCRPNTTNTANSVERCWAQL